MREYNQRHFGCRYSTTSVDENGVVAETSYQMLLRSFINLE